MKNRYFLIILSFLCLSLFTSCRINSIDDEVQVNIEKIDELFSIETNTANRPRNYAGFYPESIFSPTTTRFMEGIISPRYRNFNNNRFYFSVSTLQEGNTTFILSYVDLDTGERRFICADPFCRHIWGECQFVNIGVSPFTGLLFSGNDVFYSVAQMLQAETFIPIEVIIRVDINTNTITVAYAIEGTSNRYMNLSHVYQDNLYFFEIEVVETEQQMRGTIGTLKSLCIITHSIREIVTFPPELNIIYHQGVIKMTGDRLYLLSMTGLFSIDSSLENKRLIYTFRTSDDYFTTFRYYDTNTGEFFFLVTNFRNRTGTIYVYYDGEVRALDMPHENIVNFQLTANRIYYSPFNCIFYGMGSLLAGDIPIYDYTGGRIYVTDRHNRMEYELILNVGEDLFMRGYTIVGDYVYFHHSGLERIIENPAMVEGFGLDKVRINFRENTIRFFGFSD